jgi:hypothetical protein
LTGLSAKLQRPYLMLLENSEYYGWREDLIAFLKERPVNAAA